MTHTPGPWMVDPDRLFDILYDDRDTEGVTPIVASVHTDNTDPEQWLADARLIAAAPDMLGALRLARGTLAGVPDDAERQEALAAVRAAIAKAEGRL